MKPQTRFELLWKYVDICRTQAELSSRLMGCMRAIRDQVPEGLYLVGDTVLRVNHFESNDPPIVVYGELEPDGYLGDPPADDNDDDDDDADEVDLLKEVKPLERPLDA